MRTLPTNGATAPDKKGKTYTSAFTIVNRHGRREKIALIEPGDARKTLGAYTCIKGGSKAHLKNIVEDKGLKWGDQIIASRYLKVQDNWLSYSVQFKPRVQWGMVSICSAPGKVDDVMKKIYYKALPRLGVNRHISRTMRTLPEEFQGLGLFDLNIDRLSAKVLFLRRYWRTEDATGHFLKQAFEIFLMDLGMGGNTFELSYRRYGHLSEQSWFHDLWRLCDHFRITLEVSEDNSIPLTRSGDRSLMECFTKLGFSKEQESVLGRWCRFKKVYSLADILECDGTTVRSDMLTYGEGQSERLFSRERPRRSDRDFWTSSIRAITSANMTMSPPLGSYLQMPHNHRGWMCSRDLEELYIEHADTSYSVFRRDGLGRRLRRQPYCYSHDTLDIVEPTLLASVDVYDDKRVYLQSVAERPQATIPESLSLVDTLMSWPNPSLWDDFRCDGDGEWIRRGLTTGTIRAASDGSYMPAVDPKVCSAAVVIECTATGQRASLTLVERSEDADNYRAEALGSVALLLILRAATSRNLPYSKCEAYCDNKGIVGHAKKYKEPLPDKQAQADLISMIRLHMRDLPVEVDYAHVFGHLDEILRWDQLTPVQRLNVLCDSLAKRALLEAIGTQRFISSDFPFEQIRLKCGTQKYTGPPARDIYRWWGSRTARDYYHQRGKIHESHFHLIHWKCVGKTMKKFPKRFRNWVTKHVSGTCGCNHFLAKWRRRKKSKRGREASQSTTPDSVQVNPHWPRRGAPKVTSKCPMCSERETTEHITLCANKTRDALYTKSVDALCDWMERCHTDPKLAAMIESYLRARNTSTMVESCPWTTHSKYGVLAEYHDKLGWQNFIEGRLLSYYVDIQRSYLATQKTYLTAEGWGKGIIEQLLRITHKQWLLRNSLMHHKCADGRTMAEKRSIANRVKDLLWIDPEDLHEDDRPLLYEDPEELGASSSTNQAYWVACVEAALLSAAHAVGDTPPGLDTEGSIRYRRRRKRME